MTDRLALILSAALVSILGLLASAPSTAQDDLGDIEIPQQRLPLCFGFSSIRSERALAVCDALSLDENVKARELSEQWIREEPDNPAAQFAYAEVLFTVEGNLPRSLFHLNRAEALTGYQSMEEAFEAGDVTWHYLTLSQLSYVHQLMGNQEESLRYLDLISEIYGQDMESFRGWPLIKLKRWEAARQSALSVLENTDDERARARAWNTLCAVELASLEPVESMGACDQAVSEDEELAAAGRTDTVYLTNASEVALSLLQMDQAEDYLDRATRTLNPASVADPWVYKLYLVMSQGRFDEARRAMERMLIWRNQQEPIVNVMNRAEHFLVSAGFLLLAGYAEDAVRLSGTALNQPDRNGSYSADDEQKDAYAALVNMMANRVAYEQTLERLATRPLLERWQSQLTAQSLRFDAWRAERRAAALFADAEVLQSRVRPYAPLDVHIPEWQEPEIVAIVGPGVMSSLLDEALSNGAFQLNEGYYFSYRTEIAALNGNAGRVREHGEQALALLPQQEVLLRARIQARIGEAAWRQGDRRSALTYYEQALTGDPGVLRRLGLSLPVAIAADATPISRDAASYLRRSPRFHQHESGLPLTLRSQPQPSICLGRADGDALSCYTLGPPGEAGDRRGGEIESDAPVDEDPAQRLVRRFQDRVFGLGFEISKAQRSMLLGSSVILRNQRGELLRNQDPFLVR